MEVKVSREGAMIRQGEKKRSILTGKVYEVKATGDMWVILESLDGSTEVCTERDNLKLFYENLEEAENLKELDLSVQPDPSSAPDP